MKNYSTSYKFVENGISYEAKINGQIFETANAEIDFYSVPNLRSGFANKIINAVIGILSDEEKGMFINGKSSSLVDAQLMQSNANGAYALRIDDNLYPISININIDVTSNPFELLKR